MLSQGTTCVDKNTLKSQSNFNPSDFCSARVVVVKHCTCKEYCIVYDHVISSFGINYGILFSLRVQ